MRVALLVALLGLSRSAAADCPTDTLQVGLPPAPSATEPSARVQVRFRGGDPWAGPAGGACVRQDGHEVHLPSGEPGSFRVKANESEMLSFVIDGEVLHISMPPGSELSVNGAACTPYHLSGPDLDVVDHRGRRPGAPGNITITGASPPRACDPLSLPDDARSCRFKPQRGFCAVPRINIRGVRHSFWPRSGEEWLLDHTELANGRIRLERVP